MRAISSVGQSYRLITGWSKVRALDGPPKKGISPLRGDAFFCVAIEYGENLGGNDNGIAVYFANGEMGEPLMA